MIEIVSGLSLVCYYFMLIVSKNPFSNFDDFFPHRRQVQCTESIASNVIDNGTLIIYGIFFAFNRPTDCKVSSNKIALSFKFFNASQFKGVEKESKTVEKLLFIELRKKMDSPTKKRMA